jgi:hypothetical protein
MIVARSFGLTEIRCLLPINDVDESFAAQEILEDLSVRFKGFTRSALEGDGRFLGRFAPENAPHVDDDILYVIALARDSETTPEKLAEIHNQAHNSYSFYGSPQEAIWLVHTRVQVYGEA